MIHSKYSNMLMLSKNVHMLTVLFVRGLTDIMSLITLKKGKDAFHYAGHYQWRDGRRPSNNMIVVNDYIIVESADKSVFY
ncbi:hypothetical protein [Rossellomorea vietnamensis]|uniref:hypothetical protein n=1 Tax=Rossellomorea vietnamensis TaxID=218284 RepID=UPI001C02AA16|nr:hypothetical protein [Rossellomorea vietnamensis]